MRCLTCNTDLINIHYRDTNNSYILEKDNTESTFCGNGCIAIALILKKYYSNIILINKINLQTEINIVNNQIIFSCTYNTLRFRK